MYIFGIISTPAAPLDLPQGVSNTVEVVAAGDIAAIAEAGIDWEALQADDARLIEAVVAHDRVMQHIFQQTTILPLRFGTRIAQRTDLHRHLTNHQADYSQQLAQMAGYAEYVLKLTPRQLTDSAEPPPTDTRGKDYFLAKKKHYQTQQAQQQRQQQELETFLAAIAAHYPHQVLEATAPLTKLALLVHQPTQTDQLARHYQAWETHCQQWVLELSGALPPYHFVTPEPPDNGHASGE